MNVQELIDRLAYFDADAGVMFTDDGIIVQMGKVGQATITHNERFYSEDELISM